MKHEVFVFSLKLRSDMIKALGYKLRSRAEIVFGRFWETKRQVNYG